MVQSPHILKIGTNPRKIKENLSGILDQSAIDRIEQEIINNCIALFKLGLIHYRFAIRQKNPNWRQVISRLYYAGYNICRAVRLFNSGDYSTESKDHQSFSKLPDDFPSKARFVSQMQILRDDRNTADYDHTAKSSDLILGRKESTDLIEDLIDSAKNYLRNNGLQL